MTHFRAVDDHAGVFDIAQFGQRKDGFETVSDESVTQDFGPCPLLQIAA